ncbi:MAG TPA: uroporphyrinogen decarboxylase family protein [Fimbriimonas sp.]
MSLSPKERIARAARNQEVDRLPTIGGWIGGVANLSALAGIPTEEYLADPYRGMVLAHKALDVDGMIQPAVPTRLDQIRTGLVEESSFLDREPEELLALAETLPDTEEGALEGFDRNAEEARYREYFERALGGWDGIVPVPNFWEIGGHFPLYTEFGYTAFLSACALYPDAVGRIWHHRSVASRERAKILLGLYRDYDLVPLMFCGEDLCNNHGPMVSPAFLREQYLPTVRRIIEPLVEAGIRLIHHCDGDVRPLVDDFIEIGFSGFQGFQYELGIDLYDLRRRRSRLGEEPVIFAGLSVTRTLPFGSEKELREEVEYFVDATDGGRGLFLHTSNVTGVEVPPENLRYAYRHAHEPGLLLQNRHRHAEWPNGGL